MFGDKVCRITSSMISGGNLARIEDIALSETEETPEGERRSVEVKQRMRKRPVEGKSTPR